MLTLERAHDDVAPGGVGEGVEHAIGPLFGEKIYNHLVVDYADLANVATPSCGRAGQALT